MKNVVFTLAAASAVGWIILLSGVASFQSDCGSQSYGIGGTSGYLGPVNCSNFLNYPWWITWFQFAVLCGAVVVAYFDTGSVALLSFLIMVTILLMDTANSFLYYNNLEFGDSASVNKSRPRTIAAGAIISTIFNMVLIGVLGLEIEKHTTTSNRYKEGPGPATANTVTTSTAAAAAGRTAAGPAAGRTTVSGV